MHVGGGVSTSIHFTGISRIFSLDLDRRGNFPGRRVCTGGHCWLAGNARNRRTSPDRPAHLDSYACTFAPAKVPWPPCIPAFRILAKGSGPRQMAHAPSSFPLAMPFQTGRIRRLRCNQNYVAKFPGSAASSLCPESGGSRQPLDRQVRYYSEWATVASRLLGTSARKELGGGNRCRKLTQKPKRHSPVEWRFDSRLGHWPPETMAGS